MMFFCQVYSSLLLSQQKEIINVFQNLWCYEWTMEIVDSLRYDNVLNHLFHYNRETDLIQEWMFSMIEKNPNEDVKIKFFRKMIRNDVWFSKNTVKKFNIYLTLFANGEIENIENNIIERVLWNLKDDFSIKGKDMTDAMIKELIKRWYGQEYFQDFIFSCYKDVQHYFCMKLAEYNIIIVPFSWDDYPF